MKWLLPLLLTGCATGRVQTTAESVEVTGVAVGDGTLMVIDRMRWPVAAVIILCALGYLCRNISVVFRGHIETQKGCPINEEE